VEKAPCSEFWVICGRSGVRSSLWFISLPLLLNQVVILIHVEFLTGGSVTKPAASKLFYVPQKPYLALGTFRDQVIYPDTRENALAKGYDDIKLMELLKVVHLGYLVDREGGWNAVQDWAEV
jgi:ABC-type uncharacterized transport system fused permease/ATPase subunit